MPFIGRARADAVAQVQGRGCNRQVVGRNHRSGPRELRGDVGSHGRDFAIELHDRNKVGQRIEPGPLTIPWSSEASVRNYSRPRMSGVAFLIHKFVPRSCGVRHGH